MFWLPIEDCGPPDPGPPNAGSRLGPPAAAVRGAVLSEDGPPPDGPAPDRPPFDGAAAAPLRTGSAWVEGPSCPVRLLPRSQPSPAGSQLLPAGVPPWAGASCVGWPGRPAPGAGDPGAGGGGPALAAGLKDGGTGTAGPAGPGVGPAGGNPRGPPPPAALPAPPCR